MLFLIVPLANLNLFGRQMERQREKKISGADLCHNLPGWTVVTGHGAEVDRERRTIAPRGPQSEPLNQGEHYGNFPANMIGPHMH